MTIDKKMIGRKVIVQITKDHRPETWTIRAIRHSLVFGKFIEFVTPELMNVTTKIDSLYSAKFI